MIQLSVLIWCIKKNFFSIEFYFKWGHWFKLLKKWLDIFFYKSEKYNGKIITAISNASREICKIDQINNIFLIWYNQVY